MKNLIKHKKLTSILVAALLVNTPALAWVYASGDHGYYDRGVHYNSGYYGGVHRYYTTTAVVATPAVVVATPVVAAPPRVWVPGHYRPNGIWVAGHYEMG